jgi:acyl-coenzyme A synthetase/AMP-(fatty) acid ligase
MTVAAALSSPSSSPLLAAGFSACVAWRGGVPVSAAQFVADVLRLAERLPATGQPINLCGDRYLFAVGLGAALLRGQTSLMPPNGLPDTLSRLREAYPALYALSDDAAFDVGALERVLVPRDHTPLHPTTPMPQIDAGQVAVCLLTSGSTGLPQPHAKRWGPLVENIAAEAERLAAFIGRPSLAGLNVVATVPPQHSYGFESSVLLALLGGAAFDSSPAFFPADIAAALARLPRPRALVTTPFHLKTLLLAGIELPPVDLLLSATAPLSPQLAAQAEAAFGAPLVEIYGCTEAGQVASRRTTAGDVWQTLGALHLRREGSGETEQFIVHGGHVIEPTPLADVLQLESPTRFRLFGRANDLIHVAGKRSSLAHLNYHLNRIEGVHDGAFWLPDDVPDAVQRPVAFVVAPTLSAAQIVKGLRGHLESVFLPRRVVHVDALPREATGKLPVQTLRRFALERLAQAGKAGKA